MIGGWHGTSCLTRDYISEKIAQLKKLSKDHRPLTYNGHTIFYNATNRPFQGGTLQCLALNPHVSHGIPVRRNIHRLIQYRAFVRILRDKIRRRFDELHSGVVCLAVGIQPFEGRQEVVVYVRDRVRSAPQEEGRG